jgi:hypothetical protein
MKSGSALKWGDFEVDIISHLELKVSPLVIHIIFLTDLGDSQVLSHLDDSFFGLLDNCRTKG